MSQGKPAFKGFGTRPAADSTDPTPRMHSAKSNPPPSQPHSRPPLQSQPRSPPSRGRSTSNVYGGQTGSQATSRRAATPGPPRRSTSTPRHHAPPEHEEHPSFVPTGPRHFHPEGQRGRSMSTSSQSPVFPVNHDHADQNNRPPHRSSPHLDDSLSRLPTIRETMYERPTTFFPPPPFPEDESMGYARRPTDHHERQDDMGFEDEARYAQASQPYFHHQEMSYTRVHSRHPSLAPSQSSTTMGYSTGQPDITLAASIAANRIKELETRLEIADQRNGELRLESDQDRSRAAQLQTSLDATKASLVQAEKTLESKRTRAKEVLTSNNHLAERMRAELEAAKEFAEKQVEKDGKDIRALKEEFDKKKKEIEGDDEADPPVIGLLAQCRTLLDVGKRQKELLQTIRDENMDLHTQVKDAKASAVTMRQEYSEKSKQLADLSAKNSALAADCGRLRTGIESKEKDLAGVVAQVKRLRSVAEELSLKKIELADRDEKIAAHVERLQRLGVGLNSINNELDDDDQDTVPALKEEIENFRARLIQAVNDQKGVRSQLESTQRQLAKVEQIEKVLRTQLGTLEDEVKLLDDLKVQNKKLTDDISILKQRESTLTDIKNKQDNDIKQLKESQSAFNKSLAMNNEVTSLREQLLESQKSHGEFLERYKQNKLTASDKELFNVIRKDALRDHSLELHQKGNELKKTRCDLENVKKELFTVKTQNDSFKANEAARSHGTNAGTRIAKLEKELEIAVEAEKSIKAAKDASEKILLDEVQKAGQKSRALEADNVGLRKQVEQYERLKTMPPRFQQEQSTQAGSPKMAASTRIASPSATNNPNPQYKNPVQTKAPHAGSKHATSGVTSSSNTQAARGSKKTITTEVNDLVRRKSSVSQEDPISQSTPPAPTSTQNPHNLKRKSPELDEIEMDEDQDDHVPLKKGKKQVAFESHPSMTKGRFMEHAPSSDSISDHGDSVTDSQVPSQWSSSNEELATTAWDNGDGFDTSSRPGPSSGPSSGPSFTRIVKKYGSSQSTLLSKDFKKLATVGGDDDDDEDQLADDDDASGAPTLKDIPTSQTSAPKSVATLTSTQLGRRATRSNTSIPVTDANTLGTHSKTVGGSKGKAKQASSTQGSSSQIKKKPMGRKEIKV